MTDNAARASARTRLNRLSRMEKVWREVAEVGDTGTEPLPQALDALAEAIKIGKALLALTREHGAALQPPT